MAHMPSMLGVKPLVLATLEVQDAWRPHDSSWQLAALAPMVKIPFIQPGSPVQRILHGPHIVRLYGVLTLVHLAPGGPTFTPYIIKEKSWKDSVSPGESACTAKHTVGSRCANGTETQQLLPALRMPTQHR